MPIVAKQRAHFGPFELDAHAGELYKHGLKLKLQGHPIQILAILLERPGELITREEIQQKLWPSESETFVDFEHGLNTAVRKLRQALGDEADIPQYIETLPRRGYRFVGNLTPSGNAAEAAERTSSARETVDRHREPTTIRTRKALAISLLLTLTGIVAWTLRGTWSRSAPLQVVGTKQLTFTGKLGSKTGASENYRSIQSDGRRVYFATNTPEHPLRSVAVSGGEEHWIPTALKVPVILHLSPDGTYLLLREHTSDKGTTEAPVWLVATNGGAARRLGEVVAQDAAFAPDNRTIVFATGQELFLTDTQGIRPVKIAEAKGHPYWLRWSPDGRLLRFSVQDPTTLQSTLWEIGADRKLRRLLTDWEKGQQVCCGIWTADGRYFLFLTGEEYWHGGVYWYVPEPLKSAARPAMLNSGGLSITAAATNPLGKEIFLSATSPRTETYAWDLKTDRATVLYPEFRPQRLEYSRDQRWVVYRRRNDPAVELWIMRPDGSEQRQLVAAPTNVFMARFSRDSKKLAFMARQPGKPWKIYWGKVEGGAWQEIPGPPENHCDPNWSPDGETILFGMPPEFLAEPNVERHLYTYDLRTGKTTRMEGTAGLFSPRWSPDGRYVAAMRIDFNGMSIWDVTKSEWRPWFTHDVDNPFWSPDSEWIYFNGHYDDNLWRARVGDRKLEKVATIPMKVDYTGCFCVGFKPDGQVLVNCFDLQRNVYAVELK